MSKKRSKERYIPPKEKYVRNGIKYRNESMGHTEEQLGVGIASSSDDAVRSDLSKKWEELYRDNERSVRETDCRRKSKAIDCNRT